MEQKQGFQFFTVLWISGLCGVAAVLILIVIIYQPIVSFIAFIYLGFLGHVISEALRPPAMFLQVPIYVVSKIAFCGGMPFAVMLGGATYLGKAQREWGEWPVYGCIWLIFTAIAFVFLVLDERNKKIEQIES